MCLLLKPPAHNFSLNIAVMADFAVLASRLEKAGLTAASSEWLLKALSPASPNCSGCMIPDSSCDAAATPESVVSFTINPLNAGTWDCLIIKPPTYPLLAIFVVAPAGFDFTGDWGGTGVGVGVLSTEPSTAAVPQPLAAQFHSVGTTVISPLVTKALQPSTMPQKWRATARSSTEYLVASDLNNQGTVTSGQYPSRIAAYRPWVSFFGTPNTNSTNYSMESLQIPLNEADMTTLNPKVRVAPAKQGVYQPIYNAGPTFEWAAPRPLPGMGTDSVFGDTPLGGSGVIWFPSTGGVAPAGQPNPLVPTGLPVLLAPMDTSAGFALDHWLQATVAVGTIGNPYSAGTSNEMTGVSLYRGLSATASITLKMVLGVEIVPSVVSPIRPFVKTSIGDDPRAIQLYYELVRDLPQSYPASANFLNFVLSAVRELLPVVLPHVPALLDRLRQYVAPKPAELMVGKREYQPEMIMSSVSRGSRPPALTPRKKKVPRRRVRVARPRSASVSSRASRASKRK